VNSSANPAQQRRSRTATHAKIDALLALTKRLMKSDYEKALQTAVQAEQLAQTYDHPRAAIESLLLQTGCHSSLAQHAEAMICAQRALRLSLTPELEGLTVDCLREIGQQFSLAGKYRRALQYFERMRGMCNAQGDAPGEGAALCLMGLHRQYLGEAEPAGAAYTDALALARKNRLKELEARVCVNLGESLHAKGDTAGAIRSLRRSLALFNALGDEGWAALVKANLGPVLCVAGRLAEARRLLSESLLHFRAKRGMRLQGIVLINLSEVECLARRYPEAVRLASDVLRLARRTGDKRQEIYALEALGKARHGAGEREAGRALLEQALQLARAAEDREALQAVRRSQEALAAQT
jgi:tetratricopeptide (TPR) repeat protein